MCFPKWDFDAGFLTTEIAEAGSLGARRTHAPKMNEVNRREVAQNAKRSSARAATRQVDARNREGLGRLPSDKSTARIPQNFLVFISAFGMGSGVKPQR